MAGLASKLTSLELDLPRPRLWDLVTAGLLVAGLVAAAFNWRIAQTQPPGSAIPGGLTGIFVAVQLTVSMGCLMLLGKTAKEGTIWGNLAAVAGMFAGLGGTLLAAALWAAA